MAVVESAPMQVLAAEPVEPFKAPLLELVPPTCKPRRAPAAMQFSFGLMAGELACPEVPAAPRDTTQTVTLDFAFPAVFMRGRSTLTSQKVKATYLAAPPWGEDDEMSFRLLLKPCEKDGRDSYRIELQMDGRCARGFYQLSFQSRHEDANFHVPPMAYIRSVAETEVFIPQSAVPIGEDLKLQCELRMKPNDSPDGPLVALCGCC